MDLHPAGDSSGRTPRAQCPTRRPSAGTRAFTATTGQAFAGTASLNTSGTRGTSAQQTEAAGNTGAGQEPNITSEEWNFGVRCLEHESRDLGTGVPKQIWPKTAT